MAAFVSISTVLAPSTPISQGAQGVPGIQGVQGPPGSSVATFEVNTVQTLSANMVIAMQGGLPTLADSSTLADAGAVAGVSTGSATAGNPITIQFAGALTYNGWTWGNGFVFLGTQGGLTQTPPVNGFVQIIGIAISPTTLLVQPQPPVILSA
jgi:hypothetical protein